MRPYLDFNPGQCQLQIREEHALSTLPETTRAGRTVQ